MEVIVGTAGHIDHGKTSLVKALTGVDADRLPEEKQRGITIDLGFADLDLGDVHIGFVDVPGHERFIRNMLAGASGIDLVVLVVAADEGVMPQTVEHFEICRLLGIEGGLVAVTKKDLIDDETLQLVYAEISELTRGSFLENAPIHAVSVVTGDGIEELKKALKRAAETVPVRAGGLTVRLPVDRSFSMKGFGAVVTGTLASGELRESQELELLPSGRSVRVRGLQTHGRVVQNVSAGQRTAVNLNGVDHDEVSRGMLLTEKGALETTQMIDAQVEVLSGASSALKSRQRVRVHIGTSEALARVHVLDQSGVVEPGAKGFVQLRFESPIVAVPKERFIIRRYSPQETLAGGSVAENVVSKHKTKEFAEVNRRLAEAITADWSRRIELVVEETGGTGLDVNQIRCRTGLSGTATESFLKKLESSGSIVNSEGMYVSKDTFDSLKNRLLDTVDAYHRAEPLSKGMPLATLKESSFAKNHPAVFRNVLEKLRSEDKISLVGDAVSAGSRSVELGPSEKVAFDSFSSTLATAGLEVPKFEEVIAAACSSSGLKPDHARKVFQLLLNTGEVLKISEEFYFTRDAIDGLVLKIKKFADSSPGRLIDVPTFKDLAGVSRKYAIPLIEYLDRQKVTRRAGDKRIIL